MKILCVCNYGNVRSVALKNSFRMLNKDKIKYDALNVGLLCTSEETLRYLVNWADLVIDLADSFLKERVDLAIWSGDKYHREDIGGDRWDNPFDEELKMIVRDIRDKYKEEKRIGYP